MLSNEKRFFEQFTQQIEYKIQDVSTRGSSSAEKQSVVFQLTKIHGPKRPEFCILSVAWIAQINPFSFAYDATMSLYNIIMPSVHSVGYSPEWRIVLKIVIDCWRIVSVPETCFSSKAMLCAFWPVHSVVRKCSIDWLDNTAIQCPNAIATEMDNTKW